MEKANVIGWFDGDNLVSQVAVYPMKSMIFGREYKMAGLTGVGTYPEYSNRGLMHKLLEKALLEMKENGQYICYLYPYSIPYYRRKGWEIISDKISYNSRLPMFPIIFKQLRHCGKKAACLFILLSRYFLRPLRQLFSKDRL